MTPTSSSSIMKTIEKNNYMIGTFSGLMQDIIDKEYQLHGFVKPIFGVLYRSAKTQANVADYECVTHEEFKMDEDGYNKIKRFNWTAGRPIVCCSVIFTLNFTNDLGLPEKIIVHTLEEPLFTHYLTLKEVYNHEKSGYQLVPIKGPIQISPDLTKFLHVIDAGLQNTNLETN